MNTVIQEWEKGFIGHTESLKIIYCAMLSRGHILLEGPPGVGKTQLAHTIAQSLGLQFNRIQFTPDVLPSDVTGIKFFHPGSKQFEIKFGPVFTNILLADEINRATPRTQSSLLEAMQEHTITIDDTTHVLPEPFFVIGTQNNIETNQGTYPLPEAQLDRFIVKINVTYPDIDAEKNILLKQFTNIQNVLDKETLIAHQKEIEKIHVDEDLTTYIVQILNETRNHYNITTGLSTRAGIQIRQMAQSYAYMHDRKYVIPDDIQAVLPYVALHKIQFNNHVRHHNEKIDCLNECLGNIHVPL